MSDAWNNQDPQPAGRHAADVPVPEEQTAPAPAEGDIADREPVDAAHGDGAHGDPAGGEGTQPARERPENDLSVLAADAAHPFDQTNGIIDGLEGDADDPEQFDERVGNDHARGVPAVAPIINARPDEGERRSE